MSWEREEARSEERSTGSTGSSPEGGRKHPGTPSPYPLLLAGHEGLEAGCHPEAQLVDQRGLVLAVDLHLDPGFERGLVCGREKQRGAEPGCQRERNFCLLPFPSANPFLCMSSHPSIPLLCLVLVPSTSDPCSPELGESSRESARLYL